MEIVPYRLPSTPDESFTGTTKLNASWRSSDDKSQFLRPRDRRKPRNSGNLKSEITCSTLLVLYQRIGNKDLSDRRAQENTKTLCVLEDMEGVRTTNIYQKKKRQQIWN
ncbi:hypothetical protein NE237_006718 [Protea cynaroides]|uniref:Uncharacterized protein n=1 Tax=Protea cynaroides TaxID=273540 RepID=A0A9Q0QVT1_9MAGN|nr:hypothetical protein NE237_006718 [Protea cynaroides]